MNDDNEEQHRWKRVRDSFEALMWCLFGLAVTTLIGIIVWFAIQIWESLS